MDDKFVVTGGGRGGGRKKKVAVFTEAGAVTYMRNLKTGRFWHACSKFVNDDGDTVSLLWSVEYIVITTLHIGITGYWRYGRKCPAFFHGDLRWL